MIDITLLQAARSARLAGDYHDARTLYQQVAYSYNDFTELEKEAFSKEVADFAGNDDPMYRDILNAIIQFIRNSEEPVLQSQLTNIIKQGYGEPGAELMRYVLYYAEYRDEIKRIKRGRSYLLELPVSELKHIQIEDNSQSNPPKLLEEKTIYFESKRLEKLMEEERQDYEEALVRARKEAILQREEALRQKIQAEKMNLQNNNEANKDPDAAIAGLFFFIVFFVIVIAIFT